MEKNPEKNPKNTIFWIKKTKKKKQGRKNPEKKKVFFGRKNGGVFIYLSGKKTRSFGKKDKNRPDLTQKKRFLA